jgi:tRNA threonylcarbamoyladenosine biosynthesis protein TsaB
MRVLALDTTTRALSAAVVADDRILATHVADLSRAHAERLPGDLLRVLADAGTELSSIDVFAVAAGPGSFTGVRIGIATMQGLAFVNRRRIVAVSALEALAHAAEAGEAGHDVHPAAEGTIVGAWIDAHRRDVFSALYRVTAAPAFSRRRLVEIDGPAVGDPAATLMRWASSAAVPDVFIGSGAVLYAAVIEARADRWRVRPPPPLAPVIGLIAAERASNGETVDPAGVRPLYVRRPDAEIARDKAQPPRTQRTQR